MLRAWRFAWLTTIRQPGRTCLGVLGIAAVGALLFDMLLLSRGLVISFQDLLDRVGFDVRVLATDAAPFAGPPLTDADGVMAALAGLPQVTAVVPVSLHDVEVAPAGGRVQFMGVGAQSRPMWTVLEGRDFAAAAGSPPQIVVNKTMAARVRLSPGSTVQLRGTCGSQADALPPVAFEVTGLAAFPFDDQDAETIAGRLSDLRRLCGAEQDRTADMVLVKADPDRGADQAALAIRAARPELYVVTNEELVDHFNRVEFSYFRQISFVLETITVFFGFLLIAVLLTASVNQRLGEIAALRALGLSRLRVVAGVLSESVIVVGAGGLIAVPFGEVLSIWLDRILRNLPGIPVDAHFFVFEPRVLLVYGSLLAAASVGAALYPMRIVSRLPIAATLRREVVG